MSVLPEDLLDRAALARLHRQGLARLLAQILPGNRFCAEKLAGLDLTRPDLAALPFTTKAELQADQQAHPPYGSNLTYPLERYTRMHQSSGTTTGRPLRWLDTPENWDWLLHCWTTSFHVFGVTPRDRLYFPFSFGPFLGFWTAFEAGCRMGCLCVAGGGMSSASRVRHLLDNRATVLFTTPTYALQLAEAARQLGVELNAGTPGFTVRMLVVAGEPGGNVPATRERLSRAWGGARVIDHYGMTEVGPVAFECLGREGCLHILEGEYLAEVIDPGTAAPVPPGQIGELVLTNLGRIGSPLLRYRTGDLVKVDPSPCPCGRSWTCLDGGVLGRADDMIHVRGNNVYPSAIEAVVRRFEEVAEYRVLVDEARESAQMLIELEAVSVEAENHLAERVAVAVRDAMLFRPEVRLVPPQSLPRFELKGQRWVKTALAPPAKHNEGRGPTP
jgi:phenylacetate-CoA ligase